MKIKGATKCTLPIRKPPKIPLGMAPIPRTHETIPKDSPLRDSSKSVRIMLSDGINVVAITHICHGRIVCNFDRFHIPKDRSSND